MTSFDLEPDAGSEATAARPQTPRLVDWIWTPTGAIVGLVWLVLLVGAMVAIRPTLVTVPIELAAVWFGLYASKLAFLRDRTAGVVVLIAIGFSFVLLNSALYLATEWSSPLSR